MLQIRHLEKIIEGQSALALDTLDIEAGEIVALVGPGGCGKTLLIHLLAGVLPASGGSMILDGQPLHTRTGGNRTVFPRDQKPPRLGVLFTEDLLYERRTVAANLGFYCRLSNLALDYVGESLELVGLSDQTQRTVAKLNASARRRLALARTLVGHPRLLLLDQPTLRTDLETQELFTRLIRQAAEAGALVLLTDDNLAWAGTFATRAIELEHGRIANRVELSASAQQLDISGTGPEKLAPFRVPARREDRVLLIDPADILYATSRDGKTYLRTAREEAVTTLTLQELEARLSGRGFFKAHRAYLVNLQHVTAVIQYTRNSYSLQLDDGQEADIPLSKQSERALQTLLGY